MKSKIIFTCLSKSSLFLSLLLIPLIASGQKNNTLKYSYFNKSGPWCYNQILLYEDGRFFYVGSCENDIALSVGTWKMRNSKLILVGDDSTKAYPKAYISQRIDVTTDVVTFSVRGQDNKAMQNFSITLLTDNGYKTPYWTDSLGRIVIDKNIFIGFYLDYQIQSSAISTLMQLDSVQYHYIDAKAAFIDIVINMPSQLQLDRGILLHSYGRQVFIMKGDYLYGNNREVIYTNAIVSKRPISNHKH